MLLENIFKLLGLNITGSMPCANKILVPPSHKFPNCIKMCINKNSFVIIFILILIDFPISFLGKVINKISFPVHHHDVIVKLSETRLTLMIDFMLGSLQQSSRYID